MKVLEKAGKLNMGGVENSLKELRAEIQTVQSNIEKKNSLDKTLKHISDLNEERIAIQKEYEALSHEEPGKIPSTNITSSMIQTTRQNVKQLSKSCLINSTLFDVRISQVKNFCSFLINS